MYTASAFVPDCTICNKPVSLESARTDEDGQCVHEECYVRQLIERNEDVPARLSRSRVTTTTDLRRERPVSARTTRCPYCVEGGGSKVMICQNDGEWYMCAKCGHLALPANPQFVCTCAKCVSFKIA